METSMKTVITPTFPAAGIAAIFGTLGLLTGAVAVAAAADGSDRPQAVVRYDDLNLSSPQSARELYDRITAAADQVCNSYTVDGRSLAVHMWLRTCVHNAVADAVRRIDQPALFAIYDAKSHRPVSNEVAVVQTR
jgi:UrcA family protein